jgi:hypothetical protein
MPDTQAFPCLDFDGYNLAMRDPGMTLREYVAAAALPAVIAAVSAGQHTSGRNLEGATIEEAMVADAFAIADAFIRHGRPDAPGSPS